METTLTIRVAASDVRELKSGKPVRIRNENVRNTVLVTAPLSSVHIGVDDTAHPVAILSAPLR